MDKFKKCLLVFKGIYLIYLLLAFNAFINGQAWMNLATYGIAACGGALCIWMFLRWKRYKKATGIILMGMFVVSYLISAGLHSFYAGIVENVKGFIWLILPIALVYASAFDMSRKEIRLELAVLSGLYVTYCTAANMVSLGMLVWGRNYDYVDPTGTIHSIGYRWGRLWGVYDDPNHGATISAIAIFLLIYLFGTVKKLWQKILIVICAGIQYAYIVFSDSRTGMVCLAAGMVLYVFFQIFRDRHVIGKKILLLVAAVLLLLAGDVALKATYAPFDLMMKKREAQNLKVPESGRKENLKQDYSNGRIELWKNGLEIMESSPVIGVGYRNMSEYAKQHFPNSYMVKNKSGVRYDSMHNLEMDVLVSQGFVGAFLFLAAAIYMFWQIIQRFSLLKRVESSFTITMLSFAFALGAAATFLSFIFYVNAPQNFCFWLFLGYGMHVLTEKKET